MEDISNIVQSIGRRRLSSILGVVDTSVSNAVAKSKFPAKWYVIIKSECDRLGVDCPDELFSFIRQPQDEDAA